MSSRNELVGKKIANVIIITRPANTARDPVLLTLHPAPPA
jgi:hypothetical protein